jgi:(p)ppGpp synthase/HD superfamily hydrolase
MLACEREIERICAVLHDVIEDTPMTLEDIKKQGFSDEIIDALDCLTRRDGESYDNFIDRILLMVGIFAAGQKM